MLDSAADILAPNAPPMGIPDSNTPPSLVPNAVPPIAGNQPPVATEQGAPLTDQIPTQTTPAYQDPEMVAGAHHQSWLAHVMDTVGSILGGDTTLHVTKHPDGTVTVDHDPSTEGEKWGRVAAAALGGAAKGIAVGQGPGGPARAAAAGIQSGLQQPQQRLDEANKEASVQNQQMQFAANKALTQQQIAMNTFKMAQMDTALTQEQSDRANEVTDWVLSNPSNAKVGDFKSMKDVIDYENTHGDLIKNHTTSGFHTEMIQGPDGKPKVALFTVDQNWLKQKNDKDVTYKELQPGDTLDAPMKLVDHLIKAGSMTNGDLSLAQEAQTKKIGDYQIKVQELKDKTDATKQAAADRAEARRDTQEYRQETLGLRRDIASGKMGTGYTPSADAQNKTASGAPIIGTQWGGGDPNSAFEREARMLQRGKMVLSEVRQMRGKGNPQQQDYIGRADQIDREEGGPGLNPTQQEERYRTAQKIETEYSPAGMTGQKIGAFSTLLEHLGDVHDSIQELRNTGSPYLNKPMNELSRAVAGNVNVGPAAIRAAAPSREYANILSNNRALNNDEKKELPNLLNENQTPAMQQANSKQMMKTIIDKMDPIFQGYRTSMRGEESPTTLTPRAVQVLKNAGLYDAAMAKLHPNGQVPQQPGQQQQPKPNSPVVPAGGIPGRDKNGNVVGYSLNGKWTGF